METAFETIDLAFPNAPHLCFASAAVWFTDPPGVVIQLLEPTRFTVSLTSWMVGPLNAAIEQRFPGQRLTMVLDLALMTSRTMASRTLFLATARRYAKHYGRGYLVVPRVLSPAGTRSIQASTALMAALGVEVRLAMTAAEAVAHAGLTCLP